MATKKERKVRKVKPVQEEYCYNSLDMELAKVEAQLELIRKSIHTPVNKL